MVCCLFSVFNWAFLSISIFVIYRICTDSILSEFFPRLNDFYDQVNKDHSRKACWCICRNVVLQLTSVKMRTRDRKIIHNIFQCIVSGSMCRPIYTHAHMDGYIYICVCVCVCVCVWVCGYIRDLENSGLFIILFGLPQNGNDNLKRNIREDLEFYCHPFKKKLPVNSLQCLRGELTK